MSMKANQPGTRRKAIRCRLREMRKARMLQRCIDVASFNNRSLDEVSDILTRGLVYEQKCMCSTGETQESIDWCKSRRI